MMAELLARDTGYCRGRGGSMHIADVSKGNLGANGIVAGGIPIAVGAGLALKLQGTDKVALSFFGDGATSEGAFHESVNLAAIWDLPVVFVCENNHYGMSMSVEEVSRLERVADRAAGYAIPGDGRRQRRPGGVRGHRRGGGARPRRNGPTLIEAITYRWKGHSKSDQNLYRTREEIESWRQRDPIDRFEHAVLEAKTLTEAEVQRSGTRPATPSVTPSGSGSRARRRRGTCWPPCTRRARWTPSPSPARRPPSEPRRTGRPPRRRSRPPPGPGGGRGAMTTTETQVETMTFAEAIRSALTEAMEADERVFVLGEDIGVYGGAFGVTTGMLDRFGPERIRDTPIAEEAIMGAAVGAALCGMRPVAEMQFSDFTAHAMDQLVNQAAKVYFMLGGAVSVPSWSGCRSVPAPAPPPSTPRARRRGTRTRPGSRW